MYTYECRDCGNTCRFISNGSGMYCRDCGSVNVDKLAENSPDYIPGLGCGEQGQIAALEEMYLLVDGRYTAEGSDYHAV